jgi:hypothetical protein
VPVSFAKTVVRGGYGIFVAGTNSAGANGFMLTSPFFADSDQGRYNTIDQIHWRTTLDTIPYQPVDKTGRTASSVTIFPDHNPMSYIQQWNLNAQNEIGGVLLEVGYALSVNNCVCSNSAAFPNVSGNPMRGPQTLSQRFDTSVFSNPPQYTMGNAGRGIIVGPHTFTTDLNAGKRFALPWREGMNLEFRAEFYNVFNHPVFSNPNVSLGDANFGKITSATNPRKGQMALKLYFR